MCRKKPIQRLNSQKKLGFFFEAHILMPSEVIVLLSLLFFLFFFFFFNLENCHLTSLNRFRTISSVTKLEIYVAEVSESSYKPVRIMCPWREPGFLIWMLDLTLVAEQITQSSCTSISSSLKCEQYLPHQVVEARLRFEFIFQDHSI